MQATQMAATGSLLLLCVSVMPSETDAAPRRGVQDFCRGAPDLCVFVCPGSGSCEGLLSQGFACEQRTGTLLVAEGSGDGRLIITTYADSFAFCWWPSPELQYSELPDPATTYVPEYRGGRDDFACIWCDRSATKCSARVSRFADTCLRHFERFYRNWCRETMERYRRPVGRRGTPLRGSAECEWLLDSWVMDEADPEYHYWSNRKHMCRQNLLRACIEDFRYNHPDESIENTIPLKIGDIGSIGLDIGFERSAITHWGGTIGFISACNMAASAATLECAREQTACYSQANPGNSCGGQR